MADPAPVLFIREGTLYIADADGGDPIPWMDADEWYRYGGRLAPRN